MNAHVKHNSGNAEWYTPEHIIKAARIVLGRIDLDPASCAFANKSVQAETFFDEERDGLSQSWFGRVWLNPPYSAGLVRGFIQKLIEEYDSGNVESAIVLINNITETKVGQLLIERSSAICFPSGRIRFDRPDGKTNSPLQGQMIVAIGVEPNRFANGFQSIGPILTRIEGTCD